MVSRLQQHGTYLDRLRPTQDKRLRKMWIIRTLYPSLYSETGSTIAQKPRACPVQGANVF